MRAVDASEPGKNRVISRKKIREFLASQPAQERHREALMNWYRAAVREPWVNFAAVRQTFASADAVGPYVVFNVAGNHLRIVAEIKYSTRPRLIYIRQILTHAEYDKVDLTE
jgi:mRNA interferase HigB